MKTAIVLASVIAPGLATASIVAWFPLESDGMDRIHGTVGAMKGGGGFGRIGNRGAAVFEGRDGFFFVPDSRQFALGPSFSISAQVYATVWPTNGTSPQGQIVFRGDDRSGLENYTLNLGNDGLYTFLFNSADNDCAGVRAPAQLGAWQTLLASFDASTGQIRLWVDGFIMAQSYTTIKPLSDLDRAWTPGFSIGNVQNPPGGLHNQPFHGLIRDVRLFDSVASWDEVTVMPKRRQGPNR